MDENKPVEDEIPVVEGDASDLFTPEIQAKLDALRARLEEKNTVIEEVTVDALDKAADPRQPVPERPITGADEDWSQYDLDFNIKHLYPRSVIHETQDGPRWVYVATEFFSRDCSIGSYDAFDKHGEPRNLGQFLTKKLLSSEGWKISGIIPSGMGHVALLMERPNPLILPNPQKLQKETILPPPTEEEVVNTEAAAENWAQGLTGND